MSSRVPSVIDVYKASAALGILLPLMLIGFQLLTWGSTVAGAVILTLAAVAPGVFVRRYHPDYRQR